MRNRERSIELGEAFVKAAVNGTIDRLPEMMSDPDFDPNIPDDFGAPLVQSLMMLIAAEEKPEYIKDIEESIKILVTHPMYDPDCCNKYLETPIMMVSKCPKLNNIGKFLLKETNPDVMARNDIGYSVAELAAMYSNGEFFELLLNTKKCGTFVKGLPKMVSVEAIKAAETVS